MDLTHFVTLLKAPLRALGVREVEEAAGLDAAMRGVVSTPSAFVMPMAEQGGQVTGGTSAFEQVLTEHFGVVLVVETRRGPKGGDALAGLTQLRKTLKDLLIGHVPDPSTGFPVFFTGGELIQFEGDGRLWWSDEFQVQTYYRSPN